MNLLHKQIYITYLIELYICIVAKLIDQWTTLDQEYSIEEQGLKLMLKTDNDKRIEKQTKNLFDDWENVLFGKSIIATEQTHKDLSNFITLRYISNTKI